MILRNQMCRNESLIDLNSSLPPIWWEHFVQTIFMDLDLITWVYTLHRLKLIGITKRNKRLHV